MFDHVLIYVSDMPASRAFYTAVLSSLGYKIIVERPGTGGVHSYGSSRPKLWLVPASADKTASERVHIAFEAKDSQEVDAFYEAGLKVGAKSNGAPGPRPHYGADVYTCFLADPDGNGIECRCHLPSA